MMHMGGAQVISDQASNFGQSGGGQVNYEDPYHSIALPIFSIHGNHDDPTREGGSDALAALDLLAVTNLVNYFGRSEQVTARAAERQRAARSRLGNHPARC